jgi:hypothetical protein
VPDCPLELVKLLIQGGIDRQAVDAEGRTCVDRLNQLGLFAKAAELEKLGFRGVKPKPAPKPEKEPEELPIQKRREPEKIVKEDDPGCVFECC